MNKRCVNCGTVVDNDVRFCPNCGNTSFIVDTNEQSGTGNYQPYNNNQYQNNSQRWQSPTTKNKKSIITAVIVIIICFMCFSLILVLGSMIDDETKGSTAKKSTTTERTIEYTKGIFNGKIYVNEWADLKFVAPENLYHQGDASELDDLVTDCGLYLESGDEFSSIVIGFEKIYDNSIDEEKYFDDFFEDADTSNSFATDGVMYNLPDVYGHTFISKTLYTSAQVEIFNEYAKIYQMYYIKKIDNRMAMICITATSLEEIDNILSCFY